MPATAGMGRVCTLFPDSRARGNDVSPTEPTPRHPLRIPACTGMTRRDSYQTNRSIQVNLTPAVAGIRKDAWKPDSRFRRQDGSGSIQPH